MAKKQKRTVLPVRFECQQCGECCKGPGEVYLSDEDIDELSVALNVSREAVILNYVTFDADGDRHLIQLDPNRCRFLDDHHSCQIYQHRPYQCRAFPFWPSFIHDETQRKVFTTMCKGLGQGRKYTVEEMKAIAEKCLPFL